MTRSPNAEHHPADRQGPCPTCGRPSQQPDFVVRLGVRVMCPDSYHVRSVAVPSRPCLPEEQERHAA